MRVMVFGATGMVGGGALRACLEDPEVKRVLAVGRRTVELDHPGFGELLVPDLFDLAAHREALEGFDACLYCLGVTSAGRSEEDYRRITHDLTVAVLDVVAEASPGLAVCFVSGMGSDPESGTMWARVKGEAEQAVLHREDVDGYAFRPGFIQPVKGVRSSTTLYRALYAVVRPIVPVLQWIFPRAITTTDRLGRALIRVARDGHDPQILETRHIHDLVRRMGEG